MSDGGSLGVRLPMRDAEQPVIRPATLVEDIEHAVATAADAGAEIARPPTELAGHGRCAILMQDGVQTGLWSI
jgi:predicted enzyme related to lactoylglutathione lyase